MANGFTKYKTFFEIAIGNICSIVIALPGDAAARVTIPDMQGRVVYSNTFEEGNTAARVSIPNAATGIYLLHVQNGGRSYKNKIFVQ